MLSGSNCCTWWLGVSVVSAVAPASLQNTGTVVSNGAVERMHKDGNSSTDRLSADTSHIYTQLFPYFFSSHGQFGREAMEKENLVYEIMDVQLFSGKLFIS